MRVMPGLAQSALPAAAGHVAARTASLMDFTPP